MRPVLPESQAQFDDVPGMEIGGLSYHEVLPVLESHSRPCVHPPVATDGTEGESSDEVALSRQFLCVVFVFDE